MQRSHYHYHVSVSPLHRSNGSAPPPRPLVGACLQDQKLVRVFPQREDSPQGVGAVVGDSSSVAGKPNRTSVKDLERLIALAMEVSLLLLGEESGQEEGRGGF